MPLRRWRPAGAALLAIFGFSRLDICGDRAAWSASAGTILVVMTTGVEAYAQALEGLKQSAGHPIAVLDLGKKESVAAAVGRVNPQVIVTLGSAALEGLGAVGQPVVASMVLDAPRVPLGGAAGRRVVSTVSLGMPIDLVLSELKVVFPGSFRLGILGNPAHGPLPARWQAKADKEGFQLRFAECTGPEQLLKAFESLEQQVDFVWCLPDGALYNSTTIKPLILASLERRLPIIGFSESFVRAGAAFGVFADFFDVGRQTGEIVERCLAGQAVPRLEQPRKARVGLNDRVIRLLGVRTSNLDPPAENVLIVR